MKREQKRSVEYLISNADLNSIISHESIKKQDHILIVDARPFNDYLAGHIPGSINLDFMQFHWLDTSPTGIKQFNRQCRQLLTNIGVEGKDRVVIYDDTSGPSAARGLWLLLYFSFKNVSILDGGFSKWRKMGYRIEKQTNQFEYFKFHGKENPNVLATSNEVMLAIKAEKNGRVSIIDSRSKAEFDGTVVRGGRRGHIPYAIHIDWKENLTKGIFKAFPNLDRVYSNIPKNNEIIAYCQGGYRAANTFLALRLLGFKKVKVYLGSWGEWSSHYNLPVENRNKSLTR
ncbi:MAG TPA: sulfurtransferase [Nitrososphaeraceae archaeon]|jgi:thiosulfate/3-mercaptopyruvate sulfurtransferase